MKLLDLFGINWNKKGKYVPVPGKSIKIGIAEAVVTGIKDYDPLIRALSIDLAGRLREEALLPQMILSLNDPLHVIRQKAAKALGLLGSKKALPALINAMNDPVEEVRVTVTGVLGHLRDRIAVPVLIEALMDKNPHTRMKAAVALGCIADPKAIKVLGKSLYDENEIVCKCSFEALLNIGRKSVPTLLEAMKDKRLKDKTAEILMQIK